ncbi:MAG TPA: TAXI family TRAP transporter solute-binding subunit [Alphaproteobacteria bacterium]
MPKLLSALLVAVIAAAAAPASAQDGKQLQFLSFPQGSLVYGAAAALGAVVAGKTDYTIVPVPYAGPQVFVPMLDRGEGAFAVINVGDSKQAYNGEKPAYERAHRNLRLVAIGHENTLAPLVTVRSGITSAAGLKGKAVSGVYSAHQSCLDLANAVIANYGMAWADFNVFPVPSVVPGIKALGEGRSVATLCAAPEMAVVKETNAKTPIRFISIDPSPAAMQRARQAFPGLEPRKIKAGASEGFVEDVDTMVYHFYLLTHANLPDNAVYAVVKTIWNSLPELRQTNPVYRSWAQERMTGRGVTVPYHPGAIRFYKEMGVWSAEKDADTRALLPKTQ